MISELNLKEDEREGRIFQREKHVEIPPGQHIAPLTAPPVVLLRWSIGKVCALFLL